MTDNLAPERFQRQLAFIVELDKLKVVLRRTMLTDLSRRENSAEHSWHLAMMALVLREHACEPVDVARVIAMALVHDIVEIDAGDTFAYDHTGNEDKHAREHAAAERLFGMLPDDVAGELRALWHEFEEGTSADARFAVALDRLHPLLQNLHTKGGTWRSHGVTRDQVLGRMAPVRAICPTLWPWVEDVLANVWENGKVREPWD